MRAAPCCPRRIAGRESNNRHVKNIAAPSGCQCGRLRRYILLSIELSYLYLLHSYSKRFVAQPILAVLVHLTRPCSRDKSTQPGLAVPQKKDGCVICCAMRIEVAHGCRAVFGKRSLGWLRLVAMIDG